jgi:hypothetical protein
MYYLRGLVDSSRQTVFLQKVWHLDPSRRDLATPQQAYNDFQIVTERYPNSRYAEDARASTAAFGQGDGGGDGRVAAETDFRGRSEVADVVVFVRTGEEEG